METKMLKAMQQREKVFVIAEQKEIAADTKDEEPLSKRLSRHVRGPQDQ
jgi:hypothetical protein